MAKTIKIDFGRYSVDDAIKFFKNYKQDQQKKTEQLMTQIANEISKLALSNFMACFVDDTVSGGPSSAQVTLSVEKAKDLVLVVANGEDAVFCEFGAGVYYNGSSGSSPHPKGAELGMTIGSYGKGFGSRKVWGYYDENNSLVLTRGTPAAMPMYNAMKDVCDQIYSIAREVFAS